MEPKLAAAPVRAILNQLVPGKNYGFAKIVDGEGTGITALCLAEVEHTLVPLGEPFECFIEQNANGWRVKGLAREFLKDVSGCIRKNPKRKGYTVIPSKESGAPFTQAFMPEHLLWKARLSDIADGEGVIVDVEPDNSGWTVSRLAAPTAQDVFADARSRQVVAAAVNPWPANPRHAPTYLRCWDPSTHLAIDVVARSALIRQAGLVSLAEADDLGPDLAKGAEEEFDSIEQRLTTAPYQEARTIKPSRLLLEIVPQQAKDTEPPRWYAAKLLRPRANRLLAVPEEIVDWVQGEILEELSPSADGKLRGLVAYDDPRIGKGEVLLQPFHAERAPKDFIAGAKVILGLKAYDNGWSLDRVHVFDRVKPAAA